MGFYSDCHQHADFSLSERIGKTEVNTRTCAQHTLFPPQGDALPMEKSASISTAQLSLPTPGSSAQIAQILLMSQPDKYKHLTTGSQIQHPHNAKTDTPSGKQPRRKNEREDTQRGTQEMSHAVLTTFSLIVWHELLVIVRYLS